MTCLTREAHGTISLTATNARTTSVTNGSTYFAWPILDTPTTCSPSGADKYPSTMTVLDPTSSSTDTLQFSISSSTTKGSVDRYIHAELAPVTSAGLILLNSSSSTNYISYTGDPTGGTTGFTIKLPSLCSAYNTIESTVSDCQYATLHSRTSLVVRFGITEGSVRFNGASANNTTAQDFTDVFIDLVRCSSVNTSSVSSALYTYTIAAVPGDSRAKVFIGAAAPDISSDYPYIGTLLMLKATSASLTSSMTTASATKLSMVPGTGGGSYTIDGLTNETTYAVQIAYVNEGGLITPPGPPNPGSSAPTVTPSQVDGFLSDNRGCFIATASGEGHYSLSILRAFRDEILSRIPIGRQFIDWYYTWSPPRAHWLLQNPQYKLLIRSLLFPAVAAASVTLWIRYHLWICSLIVLIATATMVLVFRRVACRPVNSRDSRRKPAKLHITVSLALIALGLLATSLILSKAQAASQKPDPDMGKAQPYLDTLIKKNNLTPPQSKTTGSTPRVEIQPYLDSLHHSISNDSNEASEQSQKDVQPYLDSLSDKLPLSAAPKEGQPYLEALKDGQELKPKMKGQVHRSAGLTVATGGSFAASSNSSQANSFESVYRTQIKYNPGIDTYFEYQVIRDRFWGAVGPVAHAMFFYESGYGRFTKHDSESQVNFKLVSVPLSAGVSYRAIQPRLIVPFAQFCGTIVPSYESRDDDKPARRAMSYGFHLNYGIAFGLDWIGRKNAWDRYADYGILHSYLVVQQVYLHTLSGAINFRYNVTTAGLAFEF